MDPWRGVLGCAALVTVVLLAVVSFALLRHQARDRRAVLVALAACAAWSLVWLSVDTELPLALVNPIQEGLTGHNINHLYGRGSHAGPAFALAADGYATLDSAIGPPLRTVVRMNLWLAGVNAILCFAISWRALGSWLGGVLLLAGWCTSLVVVQSALSGGPGQLLSLQIFAGVVFARAFVCLVSPLWRATSVTGLLLLGLLAAATRLEVGLVLSLLCFGTAIVRWRVPEKTLSYIGTEVARRVTSVWYRSAKLPLALAFVAGLILYLLDTYLSSNYWLAAVNPADPHLLHLPMVLLRLLSPPVVVLFLLGAWYGLARWRQFLMLPLAVAILFKTYHAASHNGYLPEATRYATYYVAAVFVIAPFGWHQLTAVARRMGWGATWRQGALLLLGMLAIPEPVVGHLMGPSPMHGGARRLVRHGLHLGSQQAEAQFLVQSWQEFPECIFAAPVLDADTVSFESWRTHRRDRLVLFGGPLDRPEEHPFEGDVAKTARKAAAGRAECVLVFEGLDCALDIVRDTACVDAADRLRVVGREVVDDPAYYSHVVYPSPIRLTLYELER